LPAAVSDSFEGFDVDAFEAPDTELDSRVLLLCSVDGDFEVVVVAAVAVFDGDWDLDALSDGFDCCRLCCCC